MKGNISAIMVMLSALAIAEPVDMFEKGLLVIRPGEGCVTLCSCQTRFATNELYEMTRTFRHSAFVPVEVVECERFDIRGASAQAHSAKGKLSVFVVEDAGLPLTLVAPEGRWGIVNVAAAAQDKPEPDKLRTRLAKLITRVYCQLGGALSQAGRKGILSQISTLRQLDDLTSGQPSFDVLANLERSLPLVGIKPGHRSSYKLACQQGWAPPPKNKYQQKIWDDVHAIPQTPMKIEFDPKKGR